MANYISLKRRNKPLSIMEGVNGDPTKRYEVPGEDQRDYINSQSTAIQGVGSAATPVATNSNYNPMGSTESPYKDLPDDQNAYVQANQYGKNGVNGTESADVGNGINVKKAADDASSGSNTADRENGRVNNLARVPVSEGGAQIVDPSKVKISGVGGNDNLSNADWMATRWGKEYMQNAPDVEVDEAEEQRRLRASQTADTIGSLGSLASAFANLYTVGKGANNQQVAMYKPTEVDGYKQRWRAQRDNYRAFVDKGRAAYYKQMQQNLENAWKETKNSLDAEYKQLQMLYLGSKTDNEKARIAEMINQNVLRQQNADRNFAEKVRHNQMQEQNAARNTALRAQSVAISQQRENRVASNSTTRGGGAKAKRYYGGETMYDIPSNTDVKAMNRAIDSHLGISDTKEVEDRSKEQIYVDGKYVWPKKVVKKSEAELDAERRSKWDGQCDKIVQGYGGAVSSSLAEEPAISVNNTFEPITLPTLDNSLVTSASGGNGKNNATSTDKKPKASGSKTDDAVKRAKEKGLKLKL